MDRLAAFVTARASLQRAALRASVAEDLGYELVLDNHVADADGLIALSAYGVTTSTVRLGTGVYPAFLQTALSLGHQAATLDAALAGRLVLGLGTSHRPVIEGWHGLEFPDDPVAAMREIVVALRGLFREGGADVDGEHVRIGGFRFNRFQPRSDIPIHLAALGPRMLRLAGEVADGVVLWLCEPGYIADTVVPHIAEGAAQAGRDPSEIEIVPAVTCCVTDDPDAALTKMRRVLVTYLSLPFYRRMLRRAGFGEDLDRFDAGMDGGDVSEAMQGISDRLIHRLAGIGSPDEVRAKLSEYRQAGATLPAVGPLTTDTSASFEEILAAATDQPVLA